MDTQSIGISSDQSGRAAGRSSSEPVSSASGLSSIIIRTPNWLGDCLICMPALYQLHRAFDKRVSLAVACKSSLQPLWSLAEWIDQVIPFNGSRIDRSKKAEIRESGFDGAIVMPNSFGSAWDLAHCGIPVRIGRGGRARGWLLTHRLPARAAVPGSGGGHQVEEYFDLVESLTPITREPPEEPLLTVSSELMTTVRRRFALEKNCHRKPLLTMAPGAAYGPAKQWPVEYFREIIRWAGKEGYRVLLIGTEKERELAAFIIDNTECAENLCGRTSIPESAAILQLSTVCLCNDSGVMHLAAATGCPGVAIFGSTSAPATGPLANNWRVLESTQECSPCFRRRCRRQDTPYACLREITPEQVWRAITKLHRRE